MGYFEEVYLKRVNRYGKTLQERIQNKKIHDFGIVLKKSPNQVKVHQNSQTHYGILQVKTSTEEEVINYLLMCKGIHWDNGTRIITEHLVDSTTKDWVIFHFDDAVSSGYNRYWVLELTQEIQWVEDGMIYTDKVHFDKTDILARKFAIQFNVSGVYLPNKTLELVMRTNSHLKNGTLIKIGDETWKVAGIDKITVPGLSYIILEEQLNDYTDDLIANSEQMQKWSIQSDKGESIEISLHNSTAVSFKTYYGQDLREEPIVVEITNSEIASYVGGQFMGLTLGETQCRVALRANPSVYNTFTIKVVNNAENKVSITGSEKVRMGAFADYIIPTGTYTYSSVNSFFEIDKIDGNNLTIHALSMGKDKLVLKDNETIICEKEIEIVSPWMEV